MKYYNVKLNYLNLYVIFPLLIFLSALTIRTIYLNQVSSSPFFTYCILDDDSYHENAVRLSQGTWPGERVHFRAPLYSYSLALTHTFFGQGIFTLKLLQAILGSLSCVLVYLIGKHLFGKENTALIAALICCLCGPMIYFDGELLPASLDVFLQLLLLLTLLIAGKRGKYRWWIAAGIFAGLSIVNRGGILLFIPFVLLWVYLLFKKSQSTNSMVDADCKLIHNPSEKSNSFYLKCTLLFLLFTSAVILPVTYHNFKNDIIPHRFDCPLSKEKPEQSESLKDKMKRLIDGRFVLIAFNLGINFYLGNHYELREINVTSHPEHFNQYGQIFNEPYEKGFRYPSKQCSYLVEKTFKDILSDPLPYIKLLSLKLFQWINGAEIPRNLDPYAQRQYSSMLSALLWKYLIAFPSGLLIPLGLVGIFLCRKSWPKHFLLFGLLFSQFIFVMAFFVTSRYRLPSLPILALYTAYTTERLYFSIKDRNVREIMVPLTVAIVLVFICNTHIGNMSTHQGAYAYFGLGKKLARKGNLVKAISYYHKAIQVDPSFEVAHKKLARTEDRLNQKHLMINTFGSTISSAKRIDDINIIIISMDTTRQDKLSCYGYEKMTTPTLINLANKKESILFRNAYSVTSWTLPAHASLFTGQTPLAHGAIFSWPEGTKAPSKKQSQESSPFYKLEDSVETLAEVLKNTGYRCGGFVGGPFLKKFTGIAQGFEIYDDDFPYKRIAEDTNRKVLEWLEKVKDQKFFLFLNYFDPHKPYNAPDSFKTIEVLDDYEKQIYYMDQNISEIFNWLRKNNLYDNSLIIVTADHGEAFDEAHLGFKEPGHGSTLYNEVIKIPLIIKFPKDILKFYKLKREYNFNVQIIDIFPTILDLLKIKPGKTVEGSSLILLCFKNNILKEEAKDRFLTIYLGKNAKANKDPRFHRTLEGVIKDNFKFIRSSKGEKLFFDLEKDPEENLNLYHKNKKIVTDFDRFLDIYKNQNTYKAKKPKIEPKLYENLKAIGYI